MRLGARMRGQLLRLVLLLGITSLIFLVFLVNPGFDVGSRLYSTDHHDLSGGGRKLNMAAPRPLDQEQDDSSYQTIDVRERLHKTFFFSGHMFNQNGRTGKVGDDVTSCLLHSFSPYIEREAAKRFLDPPHNQVYYANSPAILWYKGDLVLVSRIWLDREKYEPKSDWPPNHFADNWLYTQKFDRSMRPANNGSIVGMAAPKQWWVGDGPIEPRLFKVQNRLFISFNVAMAFKHKKYMDYTVMWDYEQNIAIIPKIKGGSPMINATERDDIVRDKHWMAMNIKEELYFVQNLDPLSVMHCTLTGYCEFVHQEHFQKFVFKHATSHLRGGTPFELYEWPYYVCIAHTTLYKETNHHRHYTAHMVVMSVEPTFRVVYVSNEIEVNEEIFKIYPIVRYRFIDEGFLFPVGLIFEGKDAMNIGVHVSDHSSVIIRVKGIQKLMNRIIQADRRNGPPSHGPPVTYLHQHIHDAMENETHRKYVH